MAFRSKAQRRKFAELLVKGEISDEVYERWNKETGGAELPERVGAEKRGEKTKSKPKPKRKTSAKKRSTPKSKAKKSRTRA